MLDSSFNGLADSRPLSRFSMSRMWNNYGFDVTMFHFFSSELFIYNIFLVGVSSVTYIIYGLVDFAPPELLLQENIFTILQSYGYSWIMFIVQLFVILSFVLYTKLLILHRRTMLRIQRRNHIDISSYSIFLYNLKAGKRNEDIVARINKDLMHLKGTFADLEAAQPVTKGRSDDQKIETLPSHAPLKEKVLTLDNIDYIASIDRIKDLRVYNAKRKLASIEARYYDQIKADPQKLVLKTDCTSVCLRRLRLIDCIQRCGLMRDHMWYKQKIKSARLHVYKLEAASMESSRGMAIVTFKLVSARDAFLMHKRSCFSSKVMSIKGNLIYMDKAPPPSEINWDNIHRGRPLFVAMFLLCAFLSFILTAVVYLIIVVIRAYQRILISKTTSAILSLTLSGSIYIVILLFDFMGKILIHKIVQLERHHTVAAHEASYMLRYFLYIFANRLTPLYSRTILEYLDSLLNRMLGTPTVSDDTYFFRILDFTKEWRWGSDTSGRDMVMYVTLATIFDNTLDLLFHYLQPSTWSGCCRKKPKNATQGDLQMLVEPASDSEDDDIEVPVAAKYYCGCKCEFCRVRTRDEEQKRLKLGYHTLYCRMASVMTYALAYGYTQPIILPITGLYFLLQNFVGKCKLIYLSKMRRRATTSLSSYFCSVLLTFSYLFAAATLAQGYLSSNSISSLTAIAIAMPTVILFSLVFNTVTVSKILGVCNRRRKGQTKCSNSSSASVTHNHEMITKEMEEEEWLSQLPLYDKETHGFYAYQPVTGYSEKEAKKLESLLHRALTKKADECRALNENISIPPESLMKVSPSQIESV